MISAAIKNNCVRGGPESAVSLLGAETRLALRIQPDEDPDDRGQRDIDQPCAQNRARQSDRSDEPEATGQYTDRRTNTIGEIQHRYRRARSPGKATNECRSHQRERHSQQYGLRQDNQRGHSPLRKRRDHRCINTRQHARVKRVHHPGEERMKYQRRDADQRLGTGVNEKRFFAS